MNIFYAVHSNWHFIIPALAAIEDALKAKRANNDEILKHLAEFIDLLPEEIDGDLEFCIDKNREQAYYTRLKYPKDITDFFCTNLYSMGHSIAGWNLDYSQYLYEEYRETMPSFLQFNKKYLMRQKHYLDKATRYLNGERNLQADPSR